MTVKNHKSLSLGLFITFILFLGFPSSWEKFFIVVSGLYIVVTSIKITLPKKGVAKKIRKKEKVTQVFVENSPVIKIEDITTPKEPSIE